MDRSDLRERNYRYRETLSKLFIDIAKIVLTGVVIGGMSPIFTGSSVGVNYIVIVIGIMISVMSAWLVCRILKP